MKIADKTIHIIAKRIMHLNCILDTIDTIDNKIALLNLDKHGNPLFTHNKGQKNAFHTVCISVLDKGYRYISIKLNKHGILFNLVVKKLEYIKVVELLKSLHSFC